MSNWYHESRSGRRSPWYHERMRQEAEDEDREPTTAEREAARLFLERSRQATDKEEERAERDDESQAWPAELYDDLR